MIDLKSLRSIAEEHGVELQISQHPSQTAVVLTIQKNGAAASSNIDASSCSLKDENGVPLAEVLLKRMIEELDEILGSSPADNS